MNELQRDTKGQREVNHRQGVEMLLFLAVSAIGIYALGNGLLGLFEPGKGIDLLWLAAAVAAMMILFAQMGRVHDRWPNRKTQQQSQPAAPAALTEASVAQNEERER